MPPDPGTNDQPAGARARTRGSTRSKAPSDTQARCQARRAGRVIAKTHEVRGCHALQQQNASQTQRAQQAQIQHAH